jgi:hypothetical protein
MGPGHVNSWSPTPRGADGPGGTLQRTKRDARMARKSRTAVLKRQREAKKAEKAAHKREKRQLRGAEPSSGSQVATADDLAGYGYGSADDAEEESESPPGPLPRRAEIAAPDRVLQRKPLGRRASDRCLRRLREPRHRRAPHAQGPVQDRPRGAPSAREGAHRLQARLLRLGQVPQRGARVSQASRSPRRAARTAPTSTWSSTPSTSATRSSTSTSSP